jgi:hypothetical protein
MDDLIEEYDTYEPLIAMLAASIERWENQAPEFAEFNQHISDLDSGVAVLRRAIALQSSCQSLDNLSVRVFLADISPCSLIRVPTLLTLLTRVEKPVTSCITSMTF